MKKYNNTKTVIAVSNKSAILVYLFAALVICTWSPILYCSFPGLL